MPPLQIDNRHRHRRGVWGGGATRANFPIRIDAAVVVVVALQGRVNFDLRRVDPATRVGRTMGRCQKGAAGDQLIGPLVSASAPQGGANEQLRPSRTGHSVGPSITGAPLRHLLIVIDHCSSRPCQMFQTLIRWANLIGRLASSTLALIRIFRAVGGPIRLLDC